MDNTIIKRALQGASQLLDKGSSAGLTLADVDAAMVAISKRDARAGETSAQAYVRALCEDANPDMVKLAKAREMIRDGAPSAPEALIKEAQDGLDEYVRSVQKPGEDLASAYARLEKSRDGGFERRYRLLDKSRDVAHAAKLRARQR